MNIALAQDKVNCFTDLVLTVFFVLSLCWYDFTAFGHVSVMRTICLYLSRIEVKFIYQLMCVECNTDRCQKCKPLQRSRRERKGQKLHVVHYVGAGIMFSLSQF
jgi:hypothetical protein